MEGEGDAASATATKGDGAADAAPATKKRKADGGMYTLSNCMCVY